MEIDLARCIFVGTSVVWSRDNPSGELRPDVLQGMKQKFEELVKEDSEKTIFFYFGDSPGGDIEEAVEFALLLEKSSTPTVAIVEGIIQSAAVVLCLGCKKRVGMRNCCLILHSFSFTSPQVIVEELHGDLMRTKARILTLYIKLLDFIPRRTKLTREQVDGFFHTTGDIKFNLHYARKHGLLHEKRTKVL